MSRTAFNEMIHIQDLLNELPTPQQDDLDSWAFICGNVVYSSLKYYQFTFRNIQPENSILWIWKSKCMPKIKLFSWLLLNDKLNTRNMLKRRRKYLESGYNCVLCREGMEETREHLFLTTHPQSLDGFPLASFGMRMLPFTIRFTQPSMISINLFFMEIFWCLGNLEGKE
jgi:hypothetical protein